MVETAWAYRRLPNWLGALGRVVPYIPGIALALSTALALPLSPGRFLYPILPVVAVTALWLTIPLIPQWTESPPVRVVFYVGLLSLAGVLVTLNPSFGYFSVGGYLYAGRCLRGTWQLAGIGATAFLASVSQLGGTASAIGPALPALPVVFAFNLTFAIAMTALVLVTIAERDAHKITIDKLEAAVAENAGLHAQLLASAREAGAHDERERLAGEIHDTLAQGLIGIITQLQAADQTPAPEVRRRHLDAAARLARDSLSEARRSVRALRPEALEAAALPEALAEVVARWSADTGTPADLTTTGTARPIHPELELALLRTAQEALANAAKHAGASRVGLTLSYMDDLVSLDVRDDGCGFTPDRPPDAGPAEGGFGLTAMRQRLARVAGTLAIESEHGTGTAISATVPAIGAEAAA